MNTVHLNHPVSVSSPDKRNAPFTKKFADNTGCQITASRKFFAALLWKAFPAPSEHDLALKAARVLDVSPRQVKNWLRCENSAAWHYVAAVMVIAGAEVVLTKGRA